MEEPIEPAGRSAKALIIVDVQNDFCEGGSMSVDGGGGVARSITRLVRHDRADGRYDVVVATKDWHIDPGAHFAAPGDDPDFVETWPPHCVAETHGASFHPDLDVVVDETFLKGRFTASFTGFDGTSEEDETTLGTWLADHGVAVVDIVGIATDYCVRATAMDAYASGLDTTVLLEHCAGVATESTVNAIEEMSSSGIKIVTAD